MVVKYVDEENTGSATSSGEISRSCYSFCMCPGRQVPFAIVACRFSVSITSNSMEMLNQCLLYPFNFNRKS
ncbi:hypothetical protein GIB67_026466 [Kingdonia uniflora]|uniref:Uncharacterized protein n=1 Tax=Kingdonia uniflora TaxID=39325 RepID=A0A7J7P714_9MAGN|nr:hypothetical protein GIB67_026466 [Kingdonia uniflora]